MRAKPTPTISLRARSIAAAQWLTRSLFGFALSPILWFAIMLIGGIGLIVAGVFVLFGLGSALIVAGVAFLFIAVVIMRGLSNG